MAPIHSSLENEVGRDGQVVDPALRNITSGTVCRYGLWEMAMGGSVSIEAERFPRVSRAGYQKFPTVFRARNHFEMALCLSYFADTTIPVEIEGLIPDWTGDKSLGEIERFEIFHGNQKIPLAELFRVTGDASDRQIVLEGNVSGVHWIGAGMTCGSIQIEGAAGRHLGSGMRGGEIHVQGNVRDWVGAEMRGGLIRVDGDAGHEAGGAYRGSTRGMQGGMILIKGNAGDEVGHTMRRGLIAVAGAAGDMLAFNMIAGTVLVFGDCGSRPGAGMKRGTLGLFGPTRPLLLPSFRYGVTCHPQFLNLIFGALRRHTFEIDDSLTDASFDLYHGDLVSLGRGEILFRQPA